MHSLRRATIGLTVAVIAASAGCTPPANEPPSLPALERVSVANDGAQSSGSSWAPAISADGRVVAFYADGRDLVTGTSASGVYVRDRAAGTTQLVSKSTEGAPANRLVDTMTMSDDGRLIAFVSAASNLVSGDTNTFEDVFVHDRVTATTRRVSTSSNGTPANQGSYHASISGNGRFVAFASPATNLVAADTNNIDDVFVHDLITGATTRVSISSSGVAGNSESFSPTMSDDGRIVAFGTHASNLVPTSGTTVEAVLVHDRQTGITTSGSVASNGTQPNGDSFYPALSSDGQVLMFMSLATNLVPGDTNSAIDVFVRDRTAQTTSRVSVASDGTQANTDENSQAPYGDISSDGWMVTFHSEASNLVVGDNNDDFDVFLHDRQTGATTLVSTSAEGAQGTRGSFDPAFSADTRSIAFCSSATNFAPGDTNNREDVFVRRLGP